MSHVVVSAAAKLSGFTEEELIGPTRRHRYMPWRAAISRVLSTHLRWSLSRIAKEMQRDHTTIVHHKQACWERPDYQDAYRQLCGHFGLAA